MSGSRKALFAALLLALGCQEHVTAPGLCPSLCPSGNVVLADTLLTTPVTADTSVRGYVLIQEAAFLLMANEDSLKAVSLIRFTPLDTVWYSATTPPDTFHVGTSDSLLLLVSLAQRDTAVKNLRVVVWRLPAQFDTGATYASLAPYLTDSTLIDTIPVADSVQSGDISLKLADSLVMPVGDSGVISLALGIVADGQTAFTIQSGHNGSVNPRLQWLVHARAPNDTLSHTQQVEPSVDFFVTSPEPSQPPSGVLSVGGMPTARATLTFDLPKALTDSASIVRASLILNTVRPVAGFARDSFAIIAQPVVRDYGTKSVLYPDSSVSGYVVVHEGQSGPVDLEIAPILRFWGTTVGDSTPRLVVLRVYPEGALLGSVDFRGMAAGPLGPQLRVTYVKPYHFGVP
jgi:hypothetical protein